MEPLLDPREIAAAAPRVAALARRTPLERAAALSERLGAEVWLKLEIWQSIGSFKIRGAANRMALLTPAERARGVVTASAGNHAQGVAASAVAFGVPALIIVPRTASPAKLQALRRYDPALVTLREEGADYDAAEASALREAATTGRVYVSAYNDPAVIAGQGTVALEMLADQPDLDLLIVPVGGGGLAAGMAVWAHHINPRLRVVGAQSEASPAMRAALAAGHIVPVTVRDSLADGLAGNIEAGSITVPICQRELAEVALVTEEAIAAAIRYLAEEEHLIVEGSGAVGVAALLSGVITPAAGARVGTVLCGRNISGARLRAALGG